MTDDAPPAAVAAAEAAAGVPLVRCAARIATGPTARRIGIKIRHTRGGPVTAARVVTGARLGDGDGGATCSSGQPASDLYLTARSKAYRAPLIDWRSP